MGRARNVCLLRFTTGAVAALTWALVLTACTGYSAQFRYRGATAKGTIIPTGQRKPAGNVTAKYLANGTGAFTLASQRGRVVVLNYWAAWCPPCVAEVPVFDQIYRTVQTRGVSFVGVDTKDSRSAARAFVVDNDISYPILDDQASRTALQLGHVPQKGLPNTVIIDKRGRVAAVYTARLQAGDLTPVLDELLSET